MRTTSRPGLDTLGPENDIGALTVTVSLACLRAIAKKSAIYFLEPKSGPSQV